MLIKKVGNKIRIILTKCPSRKELLGLVKALQKTNGEFYEIINRDLYIPFSSKGKVINFLLNIASGKISTTYLCPITPTPSVSSLETIATPNKRNDNSISIILWLILTVILFLPSWAKHQKK